MPSQLKQILLGDPLRTEAAEHERLGKAIALPILASDAISSVSYATQEILIALTVVGASALGLVTPIGFAIATLMLVVVISYNQVIKAYPGGGGAYVVAKENLGKMPGLVGGAALLTDYILTVAVSISAGTAAITSAFPGFRPFTVEIAVALVILLMLANLRGVRESGFLFAWPTYLFVVLIAVMLGVGLFRELTGVSIPVPAHPMPAQAEPLTLLLVARAFAAGCTALTGVEAIANGVTVFKEPRALNARITLGIMGAILMVLFLGLNALAHLTGVRPDEAETIISQISRGIFGLGPMYYLLQFATAVLLVLAANTSYAGFPRLASYIAADGYLPKQFKELGYRLVQSNGIIVLTALAAILLIAFGGDTHALLPLYAIGVFTAFTLSQVGLVVHWLREREPGWRLSMAVNVIGGIFTSTVLVILSVAKFSEGAWIVLVLIPIMIAYFLWVKRHYEDVEERLRLRDRDTRTVKYRAFNKMHNHVVLLVSNIDRRIVRAIQYARSLKADSIEAVFVDVTGEKAVSMREQWDRYEFGIKLTTIESPYREIINPILDYVRNIPKPTRDHVVTVILPEFVPESTPDYMLHDQTPFWIKTTLFREPGVIVTDVPYHLSVDEQEEAPAGRTMPPPEDLGPAVSRPDRDRVEPQLPPEPL